MGIRIAILTGNKPTENKGTYFVGEKMHSIALFST